MLSLSVLAAVSLALQTPVRSDPPPPQPADPVPAAPVAAIPRSVSATRAAHEPVIDGKDDDAVWREARPITQFQEWRPSEGGKPLLPTELKIAYDAANLYVFVRCFDPHPDSIITVLARRDYFTPSDMVWLFIDSYHDRRT
ncbi:MAG TPA: sugar-binding protein, partial [Gemmatimonadales bacterium]|nr:sugar-binding protein [Gemmatimonadales bacterium]